MTDRPTVPAVVETLRRFAGMNGADTTTCREAADLIERLQAELAEAEDKKRDAVLGVSASADKVIVELKSRLAKSETDAGLIEHVASLAAELAAAHRERDARSLYDRTAGAQGFVNAPHWDDLAEETRELYREELAKRGGQYPPRAKHTQEVGP